MEGMKILAISTSTAHCSAALWVEGDVREITQYAPRGHGELLLPMIDTLLREASVSLPQLDALACDTGPGSFTGVRIGMSVAQGLAWGATRPVVAISALAALAYGAYRRCGARHILTALHARPDEVYWAAYDMANDGAPQLIDGEKITAVQNISLPHSGVWAIAGDAWSRYAALRILADPTLMLTLPTIQGTHPTAADIARLGAQVPPENRRAATDLSPLYLHLTS